MKAIATYLPVFTGFYNTIFDLETSDFCHENECTYDDININNSTYELDVVKECIAFIVENCPFIVSAELENIVSPKYYNFSNDSANIKVKINVRPFKKYLNDNKDALDNYLKERYTSCSGFISSYPNSFEGWKDETENFKELNGHYLGSLLNFYFWLEGITDIDMYYYVCDTVYADNYISVKEFSELPIESKREVLQKLINSNEVDLNFGYNAIILAECENKVQMFGGELIDYLIEYKELV